MYSAHHGDSSPRLGCNPREQQAPVSGPHRKHCTAQCTTSNSNIHLQTFAQCKCKTRTILCRALTLADPRPRSRRPLFFPSAPSSSFSSLLFSFSSPLFFSTSVYSTYILAVRGFVDLFEVSASLNLLSIAIDGIFSDQNVSIF